MVVNPTSGEIKHLSHVITLINNEYIKFFRNVIPKKLKNKELIPKWLDAVKQETKPLIISWFFQVNAIGKVNDKLSFNINDLKYASMTWINFKLESIGDKYRVTKKSLREEFIIEITPYKNVGTDRDFQEQMLDDLYQTLDTGSNIHASTPINIIKKYIDVELFGTKFNTTTTYCSPFNFERGIKNKNGKESQGSFFEYEMKDGIRYMANPPYEEAIMILTSQRILDQFEEAKFSIIVILPSWNSRLVEGEKITTEFVPLDMLIKSKHFKRHYQEDLFFYNYNNNRIFKLYDVNVVYLSNSEYDFFNVDELMKEWRKTISLYIMFNSRLFSLYTDYEQLLLQVKSDPIMVRRRRDLPDPFDLDNLPEDFDEEDWKYFKTLWDKMIKVNITDRDSTFYYDHMNKFSIENTLNYMFDYMRNGIFVRIRNRKVTLIPFFNKNFKAEWGTKILKQLQDKEHITFDEYKSNKKEVLGYIENTVDPERWWLNGNLIDNVESKELWSESNMQNIYNTLTRLCMDRDIPDIDFFINKRDHPYLDKKLTTPYKFVTPDITKEHVDDVTDFKSEDYPDGGTPREEISLAPICSFFVSGNNADFPLITGDDWNTVTSDIEVPDWKERKPVCFFRGNATGGGVDIDTNQRLRAAYMFNEKDNFDVGIVSYNIRDKKYKDTIPMAFISKETMDMIPLKPRVEYKDQVTYRYHLYIDGHCAAGRLSFLMSIGAVIFWVKSLKTTPGNTIWYVPLLEEDKHYISIKEDLSDLEEKMTKMLKRPKRSKEMSESVKNIYDNFIGQHYYQDYLQYLICHMNNMFIRKNKKDVKIRTIKEKEIEFPYKKEFIDPVETWKSAVEYKPDEAVSTLIYKGLTPLPKGITYEYEGLEPNHTYVISEEAGYYDIIDILIDYFTEVVRVKAHVRNKLSPLEYYAKNYARVEKKALEMKDEPKAKKGMNLKYWLREALYRLISEANFFSITTSDSVYEFLKSKRILDPSAGWGGRLLGAAANKRVKTYHGVDPNPDLVKPYNEMIEFLRKQGVTKRLKLINDDFLTTKIKKDYYDTVFTSPPFYDYEIYSSDEKQSIHGVKTLEEWINKFLYPYLAKLYKVLKVGGYVALYVIDIKGIVYTKKIYNYMNDVLGAKYLGILNIVRKGSTERNKTIYIWKKQ